MPTAKINGIELHYVERGAGDQTVVMAHSYLVDHRQFEAQMAALEPDFRVIAYDHREHGRSGNASRPYPFDALVEDGLGIIEHTGAAPCHWVGLSTGGFVGMRLALHHRDRLRSLILMDTSAEAEPLVKRIRYQAMFLTLRMFGMKPLMGAVMGLMFGETIRRDPSRRAELTEWRRRMMENDPHGLIRFGNAIFGRDDVREALGRVDIPTLVMVGAQDKPTAPLRARRIAEAIPNAELEVIPDAGHLSTIDAPEAVNAVLVPFIKANRGDIAPVARTSST